MVSIRRRKHPASDRFDRLPLLIASWVRRFRSYSGLSRDRRARDANRTRPENVVEFPWPRFGLHASMLAMQRAVSRLEALPDLALIDGNYPPNSKCAIQCVVGGDALYLSIAAASIVAKVVRDRAMARLAVRWPAYGWDLNAGYATEFHRSALREFGVTRHHRKSFGTVAQLTLGLTGELA